MGHLYHGYVSHNQGVTGELFGGSLAKNYSCVGWFTLSGLTWIQPTYPMHKTRDNILPSNWDEPTPII